MLSEQNLPSLAIIRLVGYGLLIFTFLDFIHLLYPPSFMNPAWELETIGGIVERVPVPLIGLVLLFYGEDSYRGKLESLVTRIISWLACVLGVLFLLMVPLAIADTWRIYLVYNNPNNSAAGQQLTQIQQLKNQLNEAKTSDEIRQTLTKLVPQGQTTPNIPDPQAVKERTIKNIETAEKQLKLQASTISSQQRKVLLKNSVKWVIIAFISSFLFFWIFRSTGWARYM